MIDRNDIVTMTIQGLPPAPKPPGRKRIYASAAERQAAYIVRKGVVQTALQLPVALAAEFDTWLAAKGKKNLPSSNT